VKFQFIAEKVATFPVRAMCRALQVSAAGFYASRTRPRSDHSRLDERLAVEIEAVHEVNRGVYGSPRVAMELRFQGRRVSTKRVARIMKEKGLRGKRRRPYRTTTDSRHAVNIAPNLVARDFTAQRPNEVWVTDVTAVFTGAGWLYLAAILDLFSRAVVGWATSSTNDTELALEALEQAVRQRRPPVGLVHHSDRGSPYASHDYVARLKQLGMVASMSRKGDCWDNAVAESFFASLKGEHLDHDWYPAPAAAHGAIADYVDSFYNPQRRHSTLGYFSPNEFELRAHVARLAAQQNRPRNRVNSIRLEVAPGYRGSRHPLHAGRDRQAPPSGPGDVSSCGRARR
jgi:transposase InsO family protein